MRQKDSGSIVQSISARFYINEHGMIKDIGNNTERSLDYKKDCFILLDVKRSDVVCLTYEYNQQPNRYSSFQYNAQS